MEKKPLQKKTSLGLARDVVAKWEAAIKRHDDDGDFEGALIAFEQLPCLGANVTFNIATVHMSAGLWREALEVRRR